MKKKENLLAELTGVFNKLESLKKFPVKNNEDFNKYRLEYDNTISNKEIIEQQINIVHMFEMEKHNLEMEIDMLKDRIKKDENVDKKEMNERIKNLKDQLEKIKKIEER